MHTMRLPHVLRFSPEIVKYMSIRRFCVAYWKLRYFRFLCTWCIVDVQFAMHVDQRYCVFVMILSCVFVKRVVIRYWMRSIEPRRASMLQWYASMARVAVQVHTRRGESDNSAFWLRILLALDPDTPEWNDMHKWIVMCMESGKTLQLWRLSICKQCSDCVNHCAISTVEKPLVWLLSL